MQPVSIAYTRLDGMPIGRALRPFFAWYGSMALAPHLWRCWASARLEVVVEFHPPTTLAECGSRKALARYCEERVAAGLAGALSGRREPAPDAPPSEPRRQPLPARRCRRRGARMTPSERSTGVCSPTQQVPMTKRLFIKTYGCQMNVYDSARMADLLAPLGYAAPAAAGRRRPGHPQHLPYPREGGGEGLFRARHAPPPERGAASATAAAC